MIIKVMLKLKKQVLPLDYRPIFISLIKKSLSENSPEEYEKLYSNKFPKQKEFTFTVKMSSPVFSKEYIELHGDKVYMILSIANPRDSIVFYNSFIKSVGASLPLIDNNSMSILSVKTELQQKIKRNEVIIRFLSPLVVRHHSPDESDRYYTYEDSEFQICLKEVINRQLSEFGFTEEAVKLETISGKKTVVKAFDINIRSSLGIYKLSGSQEIINYLYQAGMGSRRSQGFGMFEIIG